MLFDDMVYGLMESETEDVDLDDVYVDEAALEDPFMFMEGAYYQNIINFNNINTAMIAESYQYLREGDDDNPGIVSRAAKKIKEACQWAIDRIKEFWAAVKSKFKQFYQKILNFFATVGKSKMPDNYAVEIQWYSMNMTYDKIVSNFLKNVKEITEKAMVVGKGDTYDKDTSSDDIKRDMLKGLAGTDQKSTLRIKAKQAKDIMKDYGRMINITDKTASAAVNAIRKWQKTGSSKLTVGDVKRVTSTIMKHSSLTAQFIQELCVACRKSYGKAWNSYKANKNDTIDIGVIGTDAAKTSATESFLDSLEF